MVHSTKPWDQQLVETWLERRLAAAKSDQAAADRRGYDAQDEYDKAAAEECVCRALRSSDFAQNQSQLAKRLNDLLRQEEYQTTVIYNDERFARNVRGQIRKLAKLTKSNEGFEKTLRYQ